MDNGIRKVSLHLQQFSAKLSSPSLRAVLQEKLPVSIIKFARLLWPYMTLKGNIMLFSENVERNNTKVF